MWCGERWCGVVRGGVVWYSERGGGKSVKRGGAKMMRNGSKKG